jgi:adenylate kinase family enzyme
MDARAVKAVLVSDSRKLVYVSGAPGSGKTSLAIPLAAALGYALLAKDRIKETCTTPSARPNQTARGHAGSAVPRWNCCGPWRPTLRPW